MSSLSPRQMFLLDNACAPLRHDFPGFGPYLVGTAAGPRGGHAPRDIDVRHIIGDEEYAAFVQAVGIEGVRFLGIAIGQYLASLTGLPIDFQFQQQSAANEKHGRSVKHDHAEPRIGCSCEQVYGYVGTFRNPLGVRGMGHFVGDAEGA